MLIAADIHFGSGWNAEVIASTILAAAFRSSEKVLILAGDLTQCARPEEYEAAGKLVTAALAAGVRTICTPGNHDFGRWAGEKLTDDAARARYHETVAAPLRAQACVTGWNRYDSISVIGRDVFVALRSTHVHMVKPNRITGEQLEWATAALRTMDLAGKRLHLVTHRSLWQDAADRHPGMRRRRRLEERLLEPFAFSTFIHGHNHRFVSQRRTTPKLGLAIDRLGALGLTARNRAAATGLIEWDPARRGSARLVPCGM